MAITIITWRDTIQDPSWATHEETECPVIETIGWEVFRDEMTIKVGGSKDEEGNISGIIAIPIGCVIKCQRMPDY